MNENSTSWTTFWFESNQFFDLVQGPDDWERLRCAYPDKPVEWFLRAREATYRDTRPLAERDRFPNYGTRAEHDGDRTLRDFFQARGMEVPQDEVSPGTVVEARQMGTVWIAKRGEQTAIGVSEDDARQGVTDRSVRASQDCNAQATPHEFAFIRNYGVGEIEKLVVVRIEVLDDSLEPGDVLTSFTNAITDWVVETEEGNAMWDYSSEDFNIGDYLSADDRTLRPFLERYGIHAVTTVYELAAGEEIPYDEVLVDVNRLPEVGDE
jgi:hypothetical protein